MSKMMKRILNALINPKYTFLFLKNEIKKKIYLKNITKDGKNFIKYKGILYPDYLFRKKASSYIHEKAEKFCRGRGIDIGAGAWPLKGSIPIENAPDENAYNLDRFDDGSLDYVFSSHCVEHLYKWKDALKLWALKLKPGGILFLYMPHQSMRLWRPGEIFGMAHVWSPTWEILNPYIQKIGMDILEFEKERDMYWSFHIMARKK